MARPPAVERSHRPSVVHLTDTHASRVCCLKHPFPGSSHGSLVLTVPTPPLTGQQATMLFARRLPLVQTKGKQSIPEATFSPRTLPIKKMNDEFTENICKAIIRQVQRDISRARMVGQRVDWGRSSGKLSSGQSVVRQTKQRARQLPPRSGGTFVNITTSLRRVDVYYGI